MRFIRTKLATGWNAEELRGCLVARLDSMSAFTGDDVTAEEFERAWQSWDRKHGT
jgi:hypothetical protein